MARKKNPFGRRQQTPGRYEPPSRPARVATGVLVVECNDPACGAGPGGMIIHHLGAHTREPAPQREEAGASNADPFADPSDLTSEGGSSEQRTSSP